MLQGHIIPGCLVLAVADVASRFLCHLVGQQH